MGQVVISSNPKKTSQRILPNGSVIDLNTKKVVGNVKEEEEFVPPAELPAVPVTEFIKDKSLIEQIKEAEAHLAALKLQAKKEIEQKRKELEELEKL